MIDKKWLSCHELAIHRRPLKPEEVWHFTDAARKIAGDFNVDGWCVWTRQSSQLIFNQDGHMQC